MRIAIVFILIAGLFSGRATAHEVRPAYLKIQAVTGQEYAIELKQPKSTGGVPRFAPRIPVSCTELTPREITTSPAKRLERWRIHCPAGLAGETIHVDGLAASLTDVFVVYETDDNTYSVIVTASSPIFTVPVQARISTNSYFSIGLEHILSGYDHILFICALTLVAAGYWATVKAATIFTLAHSITLGATALGFVGITGAAVEATIALSIVFMAREALRIGADGRAWRSTASMAPIFMFGLLHGLGFGGVLSEIGLPDGARTPALLYFNLGVEVGQLAIIALLAMAFALSRSLVPAERIRMPMAYAIGAIAAYWTITRSGAIL